MRENQDESHHHHQNKNNTVVTSFMRSLSRWRSRHDDDDDDDDLDDHHDDHDQGIPLLVDTSMIPFLENKDMLRMSESSRFLWAYRRLLSQELVMNPSGGPRCNEYISLKLLPRLRCQTVDVSIKSRSIIPLFAGSGWAGFHKVRSLRVFGNEGRDQWEMLAAAVQAGHLPQLRQLHVTVANSSGLRPIEDCCSNLELVDINVDGSDSEYIVDRIIRRCPAVKTLSLRVQPFTASYMAVRALVDGHCPGLEDLTLYLEGGCIDILTEEYNLNLNQAPFCHLKTLVITSMNSVHDIQELCDATLPALKCLRLVASGHVDPSCATDMARALRTGKFPVLETLELSYWRMEPGPAKAIIRSLPRCESLVSINLEGLLNNLLYHGPNVTRAVKRIVESPDKLPNLRFLHISMTSTVLHSEGAAIRQAAERRGIALKVVGDGL